MPQRGEAVDATERRGGGCHREERRWMPQSAEAVEEGTLDDQERDAVLTRRGGRLHPRVGLHSDRIRLQYGAWSEGARQRERIFARTAGVCVCAHKLIASRGCASSVELSISAHASTNASNRATSQQHAHAAWPA
eukprot:360570-Pleurochrysis_carterae.AAC.1